MDVACCVACWFPMYPVSRNGIASAAPGSCRLLAILAPNASQRSIWAQWRLLRPDCGTETRKRRSCLPPARHQRLWRRCTRSFADGMKNPCNIRRLIGSATGNGSGHMAANITGDMWRNGKSNGASGAKPTHTGSGNGNGIIRKNAGHGNGPIS